MILRSAQKLPRMLILGLNPAWQKTLCFGQFHPGAVNRATKVLTLGSGKGVNCAQAVLLAGGRPLVAQFTGGETGEWLLTDLELRQLRHLTVLVAATTRTCTTLLSAADSTMTELIEPSGRIRAAEAKLLARRIRHVLPHCRGLAICGTFPPGVRPDFYAVTVAAAQPETLVLVDACREIEPTLAAGPDILKINHAELQLLTGASDILRAARKCLRTFPVGWLAVTAGADHAYLFQAMEKGKLNGWVFSLPHLNRVVNPLGAGDCAAGVFLWRLLREMPPKLRTGGTPFRQLLPDWLTPERMLTAYQGALACATASCMTLDPAVFSPAAARKIQRQITIERLTP